MQNKNNGVNNNSQLSALLWSIAIGVICFAAHILICEGSDASPALIGLIILAAYIASVTVLCISLYRYHKVKNLAEAQISSNANALRDLLAQINTGVLLSDGNGRILWCNDKLISDLEIPGSLIGTSMYSFCELTEEKLISGNENGGTEIVIGGKDYLVTCFKVKIQIKTNDDIRDFYMTVFDDITELTATKSKMERSLPAVAYIVVDNLEELTQYVKVSYRQATNEIETILKEWAGSLDAVLREYDRDKYLLIFTNEKLNKCIEDKFSILDRIRNVRLSEDDTSMPITVSIGISRAPTSGDSFDLKAIEKDASAALDMALQRGGDQVAIKDENGLEYFGGRTKTIQKRTRVRARVIANKLCTLIASSSRVLVMGHKNPDFDSIGACVGIARLSMFCGVDCRIVVDREHDNFKVSTERLKSLEEYENMFIDGAAALDLITPSTLLILVDANNFRILECPELASNAKSIYVIDHHRQTDEMPDTVVASPYIDPAASSACELIAEILEQCLSGGTLRKEEANVMLSGIMVDTKNFTRTTTPRTFGAALYLRGEGANPEIARTFFNEDFHDYIAEAKFGADVVTYRNRIAITKSDGTGSNADRIAAAKAADKLLTVRGIDASFALVDINGNICISARSNGKINVQLILEKLNGGGHFDSAGAQVGNASMFDATTLLKNAIDEYLDNEIKSK